MQFILHILGPLVQFSKCYGAATLLRGKMCILSLPSLKQCRTVFFISPVSGCTGTWTGLILLAEAWPGMKCWRCMSLTYRRESQWWTGRGCFCCCWGLLLSSHARSSWFGSGTTLLVRFPQSICFSEGFTTFTSGPGPATANWRFPLPFSFSSICNYCNGLELGATPEDHSEATAAMHCGIPLARNCSPQATSQQLFQHTAQMRISRVQSCINLG